MTNTEKQSSSSSQPHFSQGHYNDYHNEDAYYSDTRDTSTKTWDIQPYEFEQSSDEDTVPMTIERQDLEAVEEAATLEEALKAYDKTYSLDAIDAGQQSPQLCAEMLLRISDKFEDEMTPEQRQAIALETIAVGHAIGHLADIPAGQSVDRTSLKGLTSLTEIMDYVQAYSPDEIALFEAEIRKVAEKIDSRAITNNEALGPVSRPIRRALDAFDQLPDDQKIETPFTTILTQIARDELNRSESKLLEKLHKDGVLFAKFSGSDSSPSLNPPQERTLDATALHPLDTQDDDGPKNNGCLINKKRRMNRRFYIYEQE